MVSMDTPQARRQELSRRLRKRGIGFAIVSNPKHIFYFTGFPTNLDMYQTLTKGPRSTSFLAIDSGGECSLLLGESEIQNPFAKGDQTTSIVGYDGDLSTYQDYRLDVRMITYATELSEEMKRWLSKSSLGQTGRVGVESWHIPDIYRTAVGRAFPTAKTVGISEMIMDMRLAKGKDELASLREATKMIDFAYGFAKESARPGMSELDLYSEMNFATFRKYGPFGWITGDVASGERALEVGGPASSRILNEGETVILDLQASSGNYWSDLCRTFVIGRPSQKQKRAYEVLIKAKEKASDMLRPGTMVGSIAKALNKVLADDGYDKLIHHAGHGVGLDAQERPWIIPISTDTIQQGEVCVIEPGIYAKPTGGLRVEDCYVVTGDGAEKISSFPLDL